MSEDEFASLIFGQLVSEMPDEHKWLHMVTEFIAIVIFAPLCWRLAKTRVIDPSDASLLQIIAIGSVAVDGYLLWKFATEDES